MKDAFAIGFSGGVSTVSFTGRSQGKGAVTGTGLPALFMDGRGSSGTVSLLVADGDGDSDGGLISHGGSTASVFSTF